MTYGSGATVEREPDASSTCPSGMSRFVPLLRLARLEPSVLEVLRRDGVIDPLGEDHAHPDLSEAVADRIAP